MNDRIDSADAAVAGRATARPFAVTHTVRWGDCDPAGIIYTPRVLDYAMEAVEAWHRDVLGLAWLPMNQERHLGAPTVRAEIDFLAAPAPDDDIVTELRVRKLGRSSITYALTGHDGNGTAYYRALLVTCFVERPAFRATAIPEPFRQRIVAYQRDCGDA